MKSLWMWLTFHFLLEIGCRLKELKQQQNGIITFQRYSSASCRSFENFKFFRLSSSSTSIVVIIDVGCAPVGNTRSIIIFKYFHTIFNRLNITSNRDPSLKSNISGAVRFVSVCFVYIISNEKRCLGAWYDCIQHSKPFGFALPFHFIHWNYESYENNVF